MNGAQNKKRRKKMGGYIIEKIKARIAVKKAFLLSFVLIFFHEKNFFFFT
jgi:hypothetical protein